MTVEINKENMRCYIFSMVRNRNVVELILESLLGWSKLGLWIVVVMVEEILMHCGR